MGEATEFKVLEERLTQFDKRITDIAAHLIQLTDNHFASNREHFMELISALRRETESHFQSDAAAKEKAYDNLNVRLAGMNEFRRQLDRQSATFVTWPQMLAVSFGVATLVFSAAELVLRLLKI